MSEHVLNRIKREGSKRILSLDGGGIRGVLSLGILQNIESMIRQRSERTTATLSDYFDLIGGTSTGAIIAACLSLGWECRRILDLYLDLGDDVFNSSFFRKGLLRPKFSAKPLKQKLDEHFGDTKIGSNDIRTGLAVVLKRMDTGSAWVVNNNPLGKYYNRRHPTTPNKDYLLREIVRASTAAPTYFEPEMIQLSKDQIGAFVDGGVSPHNNPALQLFMLATIEGYGFSWKTGVDDILMISIGSGTAPFSMKPNDVEDEKALALGVRALSSLMNDASALNETLMQWISHCPTGRVLDSVTGSLQNETLRGGPHLTYVRYDAWLEPGWLYENLGVKVSPEEAENLSKMDNPRSMRDLHKIGTAAGTKQVKEDHFPKSFDIEENFDF